MGDSQPTLAFTVADVFTDQPFAGNQLPVVWDAGDLSDDQHRLIAAEFGHSETAFVSASTLDDCQWRIRIWTPWEEVAIAGHPLVGAALLLKRRGEIGSTASLEISVGPVELEVDKDDVAWITQPSVEFGAVHEDSAAMASALGLEPGDIRSDLPTQVVAAGHEFLLVPIASLAAIRRLKVRLEAWDRAFDGFPPFAFCFSEEAERDNAAAHCRLLAPYDIGSGEDAASGSAAAPLAAHLNRYGSGTARTSFLFEQGVEMGRPSQLRVEDADQLRMRVGGQAAFVASGELVVPA